MAKEVTGGMNRAYALFLETPTKEVAQWAGQMIAAGAGTKEQKIKILEAIKKESLEIQEAFMDGAQIGNAQKYK